MNYSKSCLQGVFLSAALLCLLPISHAVQKDNLRGSRYCEIILSKSKLNFSVYSTIGLNDCPEKIWDKITTSTIKQETGSFFVYLNGPRYWVIDGLNKSQLVSSEKKILGGLDVHEAAVVHLSLMDLIRGSAPIVSIKLIVKQHGYIKRDILFTN